MLCTHRFLSLLVFGLSLFVFAGCGSAKKVITVKGTVVLPPNIQLGEDDSVTLKFAPDNPEGKQFTATVDTKNLSFSYKGPTGKEGAPPGKYKISFNAQPYDRRDQKKMAAYTRLSEKFGSDNSNLSYEVTEEPEQSITIDLAKGTVTKR